MVRNRTKSDATTARRPGTAFACAVAGERKSQEEAEGGFFLTLFYSIF